MTLSARTERLLRFGLDLDWDTLPPGVVVAAKTFLFDTLAVGLAGSCTPEAARIRQAARMWGAGAEAPVLGRQGLLPAASAAFANGFQIHCLEWDCVHEPAVVHAMSVPTAALLAQASRDPAMSGRALLSALVVAVDLAVNLGIPVTSPIRFFRPATAGLIGSALGLARMTGASWSVTKDIVGLAYSQVAGTMQAHTEGSIALPIQIAVAARAAVSALDLGRCGLDGPHDILEGPFGYFTLIEQEADLARIDVRLGRCFGITELSHKPFPTGRAAHAILDALPRLLQEHALPVEAVAAIDAIVPPLIARLVGRRPFAGMSASYARLCAPFLAAARLVHGPLSAQSYTADRLSCPATLALADRIAVHDDGSGNVSAMSPQLVRVTLQDGTILEKAIADTLGAPRNPLDAEARDAKALACLGPLYGESAAERAARLKAIVERLDESDCRPLIAFLSS